MKKIKKMDPRLAQSIVAFGCPCGRCEKYYNCACFTGAVTLSATSSLNIEVNRRYGGSYSGGAG